MSLHSKGAPRRAFRLGSAGSVAVTSLEEPLARALGPKYQVRGRVGQGGFCDVYEVWDHTLERRIALKVLRTDLPWGPGLRLRFEREARALATLGHLNIPPVHFVGDREGLAYFAMPFIEGESLAAVLERERSVEPRRVAEIMIPILDALGHAHRHGIVHRDLTPANIVLDRDTGRPLLMDFGVARESSGRPGSSLPGVIVGTPPYISPEQLLGEPVDHRSDIYAAGSTMFHLLTGQPPFDAEHPRESMASQLTGRIPAPNVVNPAVPAWLSNVVVTAMARNPDDRYQSAAAMAEMMRAGLRLELEQAGEWVEPSFSVRPIPSNAGVPLQVRPETNAPWLRRSEEVPVQAERWAIQVTWLLACIVASLVVTWILLVPIRVVLSNRLLIPVNVVLPGQPPSVIPPGDDRPLEVGNRWKVVMPWTAERPATEVVLRGVIRIDALDLGDVLSRRVHRTVDLWEAEALVVAPVVENRSGLPVAVGIRWPGGYRDLGWVAAGSERVLGYYRWAEGFEIELRTGQGNRAVVAAEARQVKRENGEFRVRVDQALFQSPNQS